MNRPLRILLPLLMCVAMSAARAQLIIEIIGGGATTIPIAIVPFANENTYPLGITGVVGADRDSALRRLEDRAQGRRSGGRQHDATTRWPR